MERLKKILATTLVAGIGALTTGCTDAETSVFVQRVIIPEVADDGCTWNPDPSGLGLIFGKLDLGYTDPNGDPLVTSYRAVLAVGNQLVERGDEDTLKPESNRIQFYEVEAEVFNFAGTKLSEFTVPATGFADPSSGGNPGFGAVLATMVDIDAILQFFPLGDAEPLGQTIVSRVIVRGVTVGGTEVETAPWDFPIEVFASGSCREPDNCEGEIPTTACFLGNDATDIDCRTVEALTGDPDASMCGT
jgi:hypothetical protein